MSTYHQYWRVQQYDTSVKDLNVNTIVVYQCQMKISDLPPTENRTQDLSVKRRAPYYLFNQHANVQHIDLKVTLFGRDGISEDLKSILITARYSTTEFLVHLPYPSLNLVYRSLELTLVSRTKEELQSVLHVYNTNEHTL